MAWPVWVIAPELLTRVLESSALYLELRELRLPAMGDNLQSGFTILTQQLIVVAGGMHLAILLVSFHVDANVVKTNRILRATSAFAQVSETKEASSRTKVQR